MHRVLVVDEESVDLELMRRSLLLRFDVEVANSFVGCVAKLDQSYDCLVLGYPLSDLNLKYLERIVCETPLIMVSRHGNARLVADVMKMGVRDYVLKSDITVSLLKAVEEAINVKVQEQKAVVSQLRELRSQIESILEKV